MIANDKLSELKACATEWREKNTALDGQIDDLEMALMSMGAQIDVLVDCGDFLLGYLNDRGAWMICVRPTKTDGPTRPLRIQSVAMKERAIANFSILIDAITERIRQDMV